VGDGDAIDPSETFARPLGSGRQSYYRLRLIGSLYLPRPPVEQCTVADCVALRHEGDAAFAYDLVEAVDGLEVCVSVVSAALKFG
jgi:hypothetical protein